MGGDKDNMSVLGLGILKVHRPHRHTHTPATRRHSRWCSVRVSREQILWRRGSDRHSCVPHLSHPHTALIGTWGGGLVTHTCTCTHTHTHTHV